MSNVVAFSPGGTGARMELSTPAYAELAVTTNFSFLRGASHPEELMRQAIALGLTGIGIADRNSVAGVVRAYSAAEQLNEHIREENEKNATDLPELKLAVGARLVFADGTPDILAYPQNRTAWGRLTRLLTVGKSRGEKSRVHFVSRRPHRTHRGPQPHRDAAGTDQARFENSSRRSASSAAAPRHRLARRRHALSRRRQPPARAACSDRRERASFR